MKALVLILIKFLFISIFIDSFKAEENETLVEELGRSKCALEHKLESCIADVECGWCVMKEYHGENRCETFHRLRADGCANDIFEPLDKKHEAIIEPNKTTEPVKVHLLPGMTRNITLTMSLLPHPIDLYYLMDFSGSMGGDKNNLITLASKLVSSIGNITQDYRLGLGSFVDKPIPPFGATTDYVFKNRMPLTKETKQFADIVNQTQILSGADSYEGTGEAMLQSIVCKKEIGWRDNSRRLLLVATDDGFHTAGDGKKANITTPNDGLCHLNSSGDYTAALIQDYPSIDQLKNIIESNSMTVIFAVRSSILTFYENLVSKIKATTVGVLSADSTNIIELINKEYENIHSRIELQNTNPTTNEMSVRYFSNCHNEDEKETHICEKLPKNGFIKFIVSIDLKNCPKDPKDWNQKISVTPIGLPIHLDIDASLVCDHII